MSQFNEIVTGTTTGAQAALALNKVGNDSEISIKRVSSFANIATEIKVFIEGAIVFSELEKKYYRYNGSNWIEYTDIDNFVPIDGGTMTGTLTVEISGTDNASEFGDGTNKTVFEDDGTMEFQGDATVWEDLRFPATATRAGGSKDPDFAKAFDNGSGSQGVFVNWFDASTEEELYFVAQLPHAWNQEAIEAHVHWIAATNSDENPVNQKVQWGLEYTWANIGEDFSNTAIVTGNTSIPDEALQQGTHYLTELGTLTPSATQTGISSMILCRVFRDATSVDDTYEHDAGLLEIDFHYKINTSGSREEYVK